MPISSPLITVPTTLPRSPGSARWAAKGTMSCGHDRAGPQEQARRAQPAEARGEGHWRRVRATTATSITRMKPRALEQVAERDEEEEPERIADLGDRRGDQPIWRAVTWK